MKYSSISLILLLLISIIFLSGCDTPSEDAFSIENYSEITDSHQVKVRFAVFNSEYKALNNVSVEVFLLASDQDPSKEFTYLDHKQITIGTVNSGEKTSEHSLIVGNEKPGSDYSAYIYLKVSSAEGAKTTKKSEVFIVPAFVEEAKGQEEPAEPEPDEPEPVQSMLSIESSADFTDSHQVSVSFSVYNGGSKALTNVVVEAYLLAPDQDPSKEFKYLDHKQMTIGTVNSNEKTSDYSLVLGQEMPAKDYQAYTYLKVSSAEGDSHKATSEVFTISTFSSTELYEKVYCSKIDPYNISVRQAASDAVKVHPGKYSVDQLLDIYDWVKKNINYLNVPVSLPSTPYSPSETLLTKSGDCKNQAVLIASMVESIGGSARVVLQPSCEHAYAIVYFVDNEADIQTYIDTISDHYFPCKNGFICAGNCWNYPSDIGVVCDGSTATESSSCSVGEVGYGNKCYSCESNKTLVIKNGEVTCRLNENVTVNWFNYNNGKWVIFDPAGGFYPGDTLPECLSDESVEQYFVDTCVEPPE